MEIKTSEGPIDVARLHSLKEAAKKLSMPYSSLYIKKLRGELDVVEISGIEFIIEPVKGFKSIKRKKKGVTV